MSVELWNGSGTWNPWDGPAGFDVVVAKTVTVEPRPGNPEPNTLRLPGGSYVNCIGLKNPGVADLVQTAEAFRASVAPARLALSIRGHSLSEWEHLLTATDLDRLEAVELNLSCPNDPSESLGSSTKRICELAAQTKSRTLAKLSPGPNLLNEAYEALEWGCDGLVLTNSSPLIGGVGGLSGPAIADISRKALSAVRAVAQDAFIVSLGGIDDEVEAGHRAMLGASAIGLGSVNLHAPGASKHIRKALSLPAVRA